MAVADPRIDLGWLVLSTANDARRSTITGTTLQGPNGSGQFLGVVMSTSALTCQLASSTSGVSGSTLGLAYLGILQNTPGPGQAADICIFGVTKAVAGLGTITPGTWLQYSSTAAGVITPYAGGNGRGIGIALETATSVGQVFSMALYGFANAGGSS